MRTSAWALSGSWSAWAVTASAAVRTAGTLTPARRLFSQAVATARTSLPGFGVGAEVGAFEDEIEEQCGSGGPVPVEGLAGDICPLGQQGIGQPGRSDLR